jgi:hypothetical protein
LYCIAKELATQCRGGLHDRHRRLVTTEQTTCKIMLGKRPWANLLKLAALFLLRSQPRWICNRIGSRTKTVAFNRIFLPETSYPWKAARDGAFSVAYPFRSAKSVAILADSFFCFSSQRPNKRFSELSADRQEDRRTGFLFPGSLALKDSEILAPRTRRKRAGKYRVALWSRKG